jgi:hypothetical protein
VDAQQADDRQGMPWSPRRGQGADAATVSVRATSAGDGTRVLAGALGDAEAGGDAEAVGDTEPDGAGVGEVDGVGVAELDGAGVGDGAAAGGGFAEPDFGWERAMGAVGAVAVAHGTLGEANAGGELWAWGFDLTVTSGKTDGAGAAEYGVAPAAVAESPGCGLSTAEPNMAPPANTARTAAPTARAWAFRR